MRLLAGLGALFLIAFQGAVVQAAGEPVLIGFDAEISHKTSTSDEAIRAGIEIAIEEINARGGVLKGRPLKLVEKDNRSVPARGVENVRQFADVPGLVAVFGGKFSPVVLESIPVVHERKLPFLAVWSAADGIIDNGHSPNYVFRLSLKDTWAIQAMVRHAQSRGFSRLGMLLPNTAWGRSSLAALEKALPGHKGLKLVGSQWYNWGDQTLLAQYQALRDVGADVLLLVANEGEGSLLVKEVAALPKAERLPMISHWGVSGGDLAGLAGPALQEVDFTVVQTFSFIGNRSPVASRVGEAAAKRLGVKEVARVLSPVGVAHAYDLTHILALAIDRAGSTDRSKIRVALEQVQGYRGLVKQYPRPFTATRHEALSPDDVFFARYQGAGAPVPLTAGRPGK